MSRPESPPPREKVVDGGDPTSLVFSPTTVIAEPAVSPRTKPVRSIASASYLARQPATPRARCAAKAAAADRSAERLERLANVRPTDMRDACGLVTSPRTEARQGGRIRGSGDSNGFNGDGTVHGGPGGGVLYSASALGLATTPREQVRAAAEVAARGAAFEMEKALPRSAGGLGGRVWSGAWGDAPTPQRASRRTFSDEISARGGPSPNRQSPRASPRSPYSSARASTFYARTPRPKVFAAAEPVS